MFYLFILLTLLSFFDKMRINGWKPEEGSWKVIAVGIIKHDE